jgi:NitT/TauT family transport system ATP-binding protein
MLQVNKIHKAINNQKILHDISFEVGAEIVCFIGPNGCGKSTLLKIIANLEKACSGTIDLQGKKHEELQAGFLFQNHQEALFPWKTIRKNIEFGLETHMKDRYLRQQRLNEIIGQLNLEPHQHKYSYELSGGLSQLTNLGKILALEPDVLLLDEPFSALDYKTSIEFQKQFLDVWEKIKLPTIIVTHSIDEAILMADKIVIFSNAPTQIVKILDNTIPRPRQMEQLGEFRFQDLRKQILNQAKGFLL